MKMIKAVLLMAALMPVTSISTFATTVDVSFTGDAPQHFWGTGRTINGQDFQDEDIVFNGNGGSIDMSGANSLQITWNAPAGFMYVMHPPPADVGPLQLAFTAQYGAPGQASSLGSVTASSATMDLVFGHSPLASTVFLDNGAPQVFGGLNVGVIGEINPGSSPFAFRSITVDATFGGDGAPGTVLEANDIGGTTAGFFGVLFGLPTIFGFGDFQGAPDPGQLLTLEPVPVNGSVPDESPALALAGVGIAGVMLLRYRLALS
jgi:hypothetical protein